MNLCVADIFRNSFSLKTISEQAIKLVCFFNRSSFYLGRLHDEQEFAYGKRFALITPNNTRWNSHYRCFSSILRTKLALKVSGYIG